MRNVIEIDGRKAVVSFDPELKMLRGECVGLNGGADFLAGDVDGLVREGRASLEVHLAKCREKAIEPYRSYSGRFNLRLDPTDHEAEATAAAASGKSLNEWVADAIREAVRSALTCA